MHVRVHTNGFARFDQPVEVVLDADESISRVVEVDRTGAILDAQVPFQQDAGRLVLLLTGATPGSATRDYLVEYGAVAVPVEPWVTVVAGVYDEGQESYQVVARNATWLYHKQGAGFSSLIDKDGLDWLSYRPGDGSAGEYRGIPNMGHPEGYCHPGKEVSQSRLVADGPLCASIVSESDDGVMRCRWDLFPHYGRLTVQAMRTPYWFLYEGTPGGNLGGRLDEENGYCVRSDGTRTPLSESWDGPLPAPEWVYFGAGNVERVLYLIHHEADQEVDSYWPMEHNMTVLGLGGWGWKSITQVPARFTVGLAKDGTFGAAQAVIEGVYRPLRVEVS